MTAKLTPVTSDCASRDSRSACRHLFGPESASRVISPAEDRSTGHDPRSHGGANRTNSYRCSVHASDLSAVEVALRCYARQTNRLLAGRPFSVAGEHADSIARVLSTIGAHVVPTGGDATLPWASTTNRLTADQRIDHARQHMPVVAALGADLQRTKLLHGRRIGICLVLEPKTAVLALTLVHAGADVSMYAHPEETDAAVASALHSRGITVFGGDPDAEDAEQDRFLAQQLHLLIDDGSRLIRRLANSPAHQTQFVGAAEETTSGLRPLRSSAVPFPVIAVNDARSKLDFDNAIGTGQSCLFTILDLLAGHDSAWPLAGRHVVLAGFGPVGEGFARHARALGGHVTVADVDPRAELRARASGYPTGPLARLVPDADLIVSATGVAQTITPALLRAAKPGAAVAVAGGVQDEIDWTPTLADGVQLVPDRPHRERLCWPDGHELVLLDRGGCINCTAGEGNPIDIMDLSFGVQLCAVEELLTRQLGPGVHPLTAASDARVARLALDHWTTS